MKTALSYVTFSFLGGGIALGTTTLLSLILGASALHIFWGGTLATFLGYIIESWSREVDDQ